MRNFADIKAIKRREYSKIFSGSNQKNGLENIFLSFSGASREIVFEPSQVTFFHYSKFAPRITISEADIIAEGATAGSSPYRSDKIFKKQANYSAFSGWGDSQDIQRGTWLCTWLKAAGVGSRQVPPVRPPPIRPPPRAPTDIPLPLPPEPDPIQTIIDDSGPVWMDRYYDPSLVSAQVALTSITTDITTSDDRIGVYDQISALTLDPGVLYMYHHFGDTENAVVVESLNQEEDETYLRLDLADWTQDLSTFGNGGNLNVADAVHREVINEIPTFILQLSADVDVDFTLPFSDSYNTTDEFTIACWVKSDDWEHVRGNQIFGNYFRGGWGFGVETIDFNPLMGVFEITNGHLLLGNKIGKFYQDKLLSSPVSAEFVTLSGIKISQDMYYWAITNGQTKMLYKIDYNGDIVGTVTFPTSSIVTDFDLDANSNVCVSVSALDALNTRTVRTYDPTTLSVIASSIREADQNLITFDSTNTMITSSGVFMTVDHFDHIWTAQNPNPGLWRLQYQDENGLGPINSLSAVVSGIKALEVDADGFVWVLNLATNFAKIDVTTQAIALTGSIGVSNVDGNRNIGFTKEYVDGEYVDYGWIVQEADQVLYKINPKNAEVLKTFNLTDKLNFKKYPVIQKEDMSFAAPGDFTGTQWSYKFNGSQSLTTDAAFFYLTYQTPAGAIQTLKLKYKIDNLTDAQWHMLALTYDNRTGIVTIYNNTVVVTTTTIPIGSTIYFTYRNNLVFGGNAGRFASLNEELQTDQLHSDVTLAEPLIYNRALTQSDLTHLYRTKFNARKLKWNSPIGQRIFLEEIERFFQHRLPGSKSNFYNVNVVGLNITDPDLKAAIENLIKDAVKKVAPVNTQLLNVQFK